MVSEDRVADYLHGRSPGQRPCPSTHRTERLPPFGRSSIRSLGASARLQASACRGRQRACLSRSTISVWASVDTRPTRGARRGHQIGKSTVQDILINHGLGRCAQRVAVVDTGASEPPDIALTAGTLELVAERYVVLSTVSAYRDWPARPTTEDSPLWPSRVDARESDPDIAAMPGPLRHRRHTTHRQHRRLPRSPLPRQPHDHSRPTATRRGPLDHALTRSSGQSLPPISLAGRRGGSRRLCGRRSRT